MASDSSVDSIGVIAQGLAAVLTAVGSYALGHFRAKIQAAAVHRSENHREREQLFNHYNQLIAVTREMNQSLRNELGVVRNQMHLLQIEHAKTLAEARAEREECRVENERLKSELKHLRAELTEIKNELAEYQNSRKDC